MSAAARPELPPRGDGPAAAVARALGVAEGQGSRALRLLSLVFSMSISLALLKAAQNGIFLAAYPATAIPWAFAASAATLVTLSAVQVSGAARLGPVRLATVGISLSALALLGLRVVLLSDAHAVPFVVYVVVEAVCGLLLIQVWSVVSETVDPRSAKRLLPIASLGAAAAWALGGLLVPAIVRAVGARGLLVAAPAVLVVTLLLVRAIAKHDLEGRFARGSRGVGLLEGWKRGLSFVARAPLMRLAMALSVLALLTEQLMDFQLMAAARERCGSQAAIASFFGTFYGVTAALSLAILLLGTGRVLSRLGAAQSLSLTPVFTVLAAAAALVVPAFATVVLLRSIDRVLKNSLWSNAMEQAQTPLPVVQRAQARTLVRGVLAPFAYALSAVVLATLPAGFHMRWLALATLLGALGMTALITLGVRRAYVSALRRAIDDRILDLDDPASERPPLDAEACRALENELRHDDEDRAVLATELLSSSGSDAAARSLRVALQHRAANVRALAAEGLSRMSAHGVASAISALLRSDPVSEVRRAAVRALRRLGARDEESLSSLEAGVADTDRQVRALCTVTLLELREPRAVADGSALLPLLADRDPALREAALAAVRRKATNDPAVRAALRTLLAHDDVTTRLAALRTVTGLRVRELLPDVTRLFDDPRTATVALSALNDWGDVALSTAPSSTETAAPDSAAPTSSQWAADSEDAPVSRLLGHADPAVRDRATRALSDLVRGGRHRPLPRSVVEPLLGREIENAYRLWAVLVGLRAVTNDASTPPLLAFLEREVDLRIQESRTRILQLLALLQSRKLVQVVEAGLRRTHSQRDAQVAELMEMSLPPALSKKVVPLFDKLSARDRIEAGIALGLLQRGDTTDPLGRILELGDAHVRGCATIVYGPQLRERLTLPGTASEQTRDILEAETDLIPLYERMRFLRSVPLFGALPGDDLRLVAEALEGVTFASGDLVFRKGDPGEDLYLVQRGRIAIRDGTAEIAVLRERDFFGELAVLDREPRSADAVCLDDVELLRLRSADLGELMARRPQIQEQIMLVLVRRIREMNRRAAL